MLERLLASTDIWGVCGGGTDRDIWSDWVSHDTSAGVRLIKKVSKIIAELWLAEQRKISAFGVDNSFRILW